MNITVNALPPNPDITILLDGLLAICIDQTNQHPTSQVGVYPFAKDHLFTFEVKKTEKNEEKVLYISREEILTGDLIATIKGQNPNIKTFQQNGSPNNFSRIIDVEGPFFHKQKLNLVPGIIQQKIHIAHGTYYAAKTQKARIKPAFSLASAQANIPDPTQELEVASQVGINVYLQPDEIFCLQFGASPIVKFEMQKEPDVSYEINISNNCIKREDATTECLSDFQNYYNLFEVPVAQRLDIEYLEGAAGSDRTPCDTIYLSQTPVFP